MGKTFGKILAILLTAILLAGILPAGKIFAGDDNAGQEQSYDIKKIAEQLTDKNKDPFRYRSEKKTGSSKELGEGIPLPSQFDLSAKFLKDGDETSYVTPVKFQNPFGSCWGFAAIAAAETSILGDGLAPGYAAVADPENGIKALDLSEKHLINFITKPLDNPSSPQNGEGMYYADENMSLNDKFDMGGIPIFATSLFASGIGPNREDRSVPEGLPEDIFCYKGLNGDIDQNKVNGKWTDYCYSASDDWSMPEELRFKQSYSLEESFILPSPAQNVSETDDEPVYQYEPRGTEAIKEQLLNKRAVEIGFYADASLPNQEKEGEYISKNWAHYTDEMLEGNHAVTIVGWDDSYPKENFVEGKQPPADGAWLVKNSWGSGEESFPNRGGANWGIPVVKLDAQGNPELDEQGEPVMVGSGYFWLSYYDKSLSSPEALKFNSEVPTGGYYLDQHDYMPVSDYESAEMPQKISMSNVFTAEANEQLEYISCLTTVPGTSVDYEIYLLPPKYKNPQDGVKVASGSGGPFEFGGFHKIRVTDEVFIQKDQSYSIIVTLKTPENEYSFNIQTGTRGDMAAFFGEIVWQKGIINPGESFVNYDGKWHDFTDESFQDSFFNGMQYFFSMDNFPIKGYCKKLQDLSMYLIGENPVNLPPYIFDYGTSFSVSKDLILRFRKGKDAEMPEDPEIKWEVAPGSESIFDMTMKENDTTRCTLTAKKPGSGIITVSCEGIGLLVIRVDVPKSGWYQYWDSFDMQFGESTTIELDDADGNTVPRNAFTYKSDNPKVASVSSKGFVKATGVGKTVIRVRDKNGVEERIDVKVYKANQEMKLKGRKATLTAAALSQGPQTFKRTSLITIKKSVGKLSFVKKSGNKLITIAKKTGKVTVKPGLKKGKYKVKVQVSAAGNKNYKKKTKTVTFTIIVK